MSSFGLDFLAESQSRVNCYSFRYNLISTLSIIALKYWIPTELWISHELWLGVDSMLLKLLIPREGSLKTRIACVHSVLPKANCSLLPDLTPLDLLPPYSLLGISCLALIETFHSLQTGFVPQIVLFWFEKMFSMHLLPSLSLSLPVRVCVHSAVTSHQRLPSA